MTALFSKVLDMSLTASIVILAVLAARYFLKSAPRVISYALWAVVLFRLLCPVSLTAPVSVLHLSQPKVTVTSGGASQVSYLLVPEIQAPLSTIEVQSAQQDMAVVEETVPERKPATKLDLLALGSWIWLTGAAIMVLHSLVSYFQLYRRLIGATPLHGRVYLADYIPTPFVLGILTPRIYLPSHTPVRERQFILAHEEHHIRRFDHVTKVLAYGALCLHWFNPLVWLAFFLAGKDMEMSCDEAVIRKLGPDAKADYAQCLLRLASHRPIIAGTPLAFGEGDTKGRVKHMAKWKKPKTWVVILSILVCIVVLFLCAVNPGEKIDWDELYDKLNHEGEVKQRGVNSIQYEIPYHYRLESSDFYDGAKKAGGHRWYHWQEGVRKAGGTDLFDWLDEIEVPELQDGLHTYEYESSPRSDRRITISSDTGQVTEHEFFFTPDGVLELWFDTDVVSQETRYEIMSSVHYENHLRDFDKIGLNLPGDMSALDYVSGEIRFFATEPLQGSEIGNRQVVTENILGGIRTYDAPSRVLTYPNADQWLYNLDVPEMHGNNWMGQSSEYGDLEVSYTSAPGKMTMHYYYLKGSKVFEIWFDCELVEPMTRAAILESVYFDQEAKITGSLPAAQSQSTGPVTIGLKLPFDLNPVEEGTEIRFYLQAKLSDLEVPENQKPSGGIKTYSNPKASSNAMNAESFLRELGVPQIVQGEYDWMASGGNSGALEVSFADAAGRETKHYYYVQEDRVFELWFDTSALDAMTRAAILESVYFSQDGKIEQTLPSIQPIEELVSIFADAEIQEEITDLERCRTALEELQNQQGYALKIQRNNHGENSLNDTSTMLYYKNGEDWLFINKIPEDGFKYGYNKFGYMYVNGVHYNNEGLCMDENDEIIWGEAAPEKQSQYWIDTFSWDAQDVVYVSKVAAGQGICVTVQVMSPFFTNYDGYYYIQFVFDQSRILQWLEITAYYHDQTGADCSIQESINILSTEKSYANSAIQGEYKRATAQ